LKDIFGNCKKLNRSGGYWIIHSTKINRSLWNENHKDLFMLKFN
jgi:hypothetical protein